MVFIIFIVVLIALRIAELVLSGRNEAWLLEQGAVESGQKHYPFIVTLHVLFFLSLIIEYSAKQSVSFSMFLLVSYFFLVALKVLVILSLGKYWNTKIYHIPNASLVKVGAYKYFKHPNYIIVIAEIALIPLIFGLYFTAITFTMLNAIMLSVRTIEEDKAIGGQ